MNKYILILLIILPLNSFTQSLGSERIERLNKSVVRILTDSTALGTGFFIHDSGWIATCHHVIEPVLNRDINTNQILGFQKIYAEFRNGEKIELGISTFFLNEGHYNASIYDYLLLKVLERPKTKFKIFKLGTWTNVAEGDLIYSCGFPLGIKQRFISQGILSTKWIQTIPVSQNQNVISKAPREVAWLDLTLNRGNSGGPIIKFGETPEEDKVIGIATFILNPYARQAQDLADFISSGNLKSDIKIGGISTNYVNELYAKAIANNSIGVSACISIDYVVEAMEIIYDR